MPWASEGLDDFDGYDMAVELAQHHFNSLSIVHNYIEGGGSYSLDHWKSLYVTPSNLDNNGLPYAPSWFLDESGNTMQRSMYEYLRDYLGYYIEASNLNATITGTTVNASVDLTNYGFAAPLAMDACDLVLTDGSGNVISSSSACSLSDLTTLNTVSCSAMFTLPNTANVYKLGLVLKDDGGDCARLADNIPYENGVNILGTLY